VNSRKIRLGLWEAACVVWVCVAGATLHFAFELSEYWQPMAFLAAVNESVWEHLKMYFWPGLFFALVQYTYTRDVANNYWLGKAMALAVSPLGIMIGYYAYFAYLTATDGRFSLASMLLLMLFGISVGQYVSYKILSMPPLEIQLRGAVAGTYAALVLMFGAFTYFPPKIFLFENFYCYQYTGEYGILSDYEPYRVFTRTENGIEEQGAGVNYCANLVTADAAKNTNASLR
jgi:hypothetical protein